jgi:O-antigen/teichoic acid export membrane protein
MMSVSTLRFEMAIPTASTLTEAYSVVRVGMGVLTAFFVVAVLFAAIAQMMGPVGWIAVMAAYGWLLPVLIIGNGFCMTMTYLAVRERWFSAIGSCRVHQSLTTAVLHIGCGLAGLGPGGLIAGYALGNSVGGAGIARRAALTNPRKLWPGKEDYLVARKNFKMALMATGSALLTAFGAQLPIIVVASLFSARETGLFVLAMRLESSAESLLSNSCSQVFYSDACARLRDGPHGLAKLLTSWTVLLMAAAATVLVLLYAFAGVFTRVAFGHKWDGTADLIRALAPLLAALIVVNPLSNIVYVIGRPQLAAVWDICKIACVGGCFYYSAIAGRSLASAVQVWTVVLACASALWLLVLVALVRAFCSKQPKPLEHFSLSPMSS